MKRDSIAARLRYLTVAAAVLGGASVAQPAQQATPRPTPRPTATPRPRSLADVARQMRLKHPDKPGESLTITNDNLSSYAAKGGLTLVTSTPRPVSPSAGLREGSAAPAPEGESNDGARKVWRERYRAQQKQIATMESRRSELDSEIPDLWNKFYAWDDPAYRDGVIKPKLDAAIKERDQLDAAIPEEQRKLGQILEDARRAGAQPGWFRDLEQPSPPPAPTPGS